MTWNENEKNGTEPAKPKKRIGGFTFFVGVFFLVSCYSAILNYFKTMTEPPKHIYVVDKIGDMKQVATFRVFADNYQFYITDPDRALNAESLFGAVMRTTEADVEKTWVRTGSSITIFTFEGMNDHRVDIFSGREYDGHGNAQRVSVFPLTLSKGQMDILGGLGGEANRVQVSPGEYSVYVRSFNLGKGTDDFIEKDEDFLALDDMERYEIVLVPGKSDKEGVIFGPEKRSDVESLISLSP